HLRALLHEPIEDRLHLGLLGEHLAEIRDEIEFGRKRGFHLRGLRAVRRIDRCRWEATAVYPQRRRAALRAGPRLGSLARGAGSARGRAGLSVGGAVWRDGRWRQRRARGGEAP